MITTTTSGRWVRENMRNAFARILACLPYDGEMVVLAEEPDPEKLVQRLIGAYALLNRCLSADKTLRIIEKERMMIISGKTGDDRVSIEDYFTQKYTK